MRHIIKHYNGIIISRHAQDAFIDATHDPISNENLKQLLLTARQVSLDDVYLHGYSPNYKGRHNRGIKSWYLTHHKHTWNAVFVVSEGMREEEGMLVLVTVLHNRRPDIVELEEAKKCVTDTLSTK